MSNADLIREFCNHFSNPDVDLLLGYFTEDATYHNMPVEPATGHEAIRGVFEMFFGMATSIDFEILNIVVEGDVVLTERVDHFTMNDGQKVSLPVMGTFEMAGAKIRAWRDYFDLQTFMSAAGPGSPDG